ncbi:translational GTPase TypA [uncultured Alistipes sp.]|uniref:translational GTPase TypA n=1 Tax=uncultured Alistipes sp. TaxID=538949 RepID=UPI0025F95333|nr:translational GTPase TypA [uncultured Alistipes sp.]
MQKLRNIAIIAHVDHGKTTLVDKMILAGHVLRDNAKQSGELILDNNDLERERGITILSKNVSVIYKDYKINIIDTPGHADFGGEVERVLNMCDGVLLLVDAFEGTMPQTRFVLQKALALGKKPIVVINKVDKPNCRPEVVNEQVFDLMFTLDATEEQLDYKTIYGSAKQGWMSYKWNERTDSIVPLLDAIIDEIPEPAVVEGTPQMLITSLEFSSYTGRIAVGKITRGSLKSGQNVTLAKRDGETMQKTRIKELMVFEGLGKKKVDEVPCGEICALTGIDGFEIGDTICDYENPEPLPPIAIDEPTMSMLFTINNSPFFGKDGKYVTSRHIKERLDRELEKNLALRVTPGPSADSFNVFGRGVLHLSVLIETMRREGYELQVGQPRVIIKEIDGKKCEPIEELTVDCPEEYSGTVIEMATKRKGVMTNMTSNGDRVRLEFDIPSRGIIGLRSNMLTATAGEAIMTHRLKGFEPWVGEIEMRINGSIISGETGTAYAYSIDKLQDRGRFFIAPMEQVYEGQVIGEHTRQNDITVNVTKSKQLTNMRASGSDDKTSIAPPKVFSLEEALEYIQGDEYVEVTPNTMRLRKILLHEVDRKRGFEISAAHRK